MSETEALQESIRTAVLQYNSRIRETIDYLGEPSKKWPKFLKEGLLAVRRNMAGCCVKQLTSADDGSVHYLMAGTPTLSLDHLIKAMQENPKGCPTPQPPPT